MARTLKTIVRTANPVAWVKLMAAPHALHLKTAADDHRRVVHSPNLPTHSLDAIVASYAECDSRGARGADLRAQFGYANPPFGKSRWRREQWEDDQRNVNGTPHAGLELQPNQRRIGSLCP